MCVKPTVLATFIMLSYSAASFSEAYTGKVVIDGKVYSSDSVVINSGNVNSSNRDDVLNGSGVIVSETRNLTAFDDLLVNISADISYVSSDDYKLVLSGDDNIVAVISTSLEGKSIVINSKRSFNTQNNLKIVVYGPKSLNRLTVEGSSDVNLKGISNQMFEVILEGSGDIRVQGKVRELKVEVDGSGNIDTRLLEADNVDISIDGSADLAVTANNNLNVVIDGVSNVTYYGNPASISKEIDGVGKVSPGY